jgi:hypothetical protein
MYDPQQSGLQTQAENNAKSQVGKDAEVDHLILCWWAETKQPVLNCSCKTLNTAPT